MLTPLNIPYMLASVSKENHSVAGFANNSVGEKKFDISPDTRTCIMPYFLAVARDPSQPSPETFSVRR
jgi:hypothetical protein